METTSANILHLVELLKRETSNGKLSWKTEPKHKKWLNKKLLPYEDYFLYATYTLSDYSDAISIKIEVSGNSILGTANRMKLESQNTGEIILIPDKRMRIDDNSAILSEMERLVYEVKKHIAKKGEIESIKDSKLLGSLVKNLEDQER